MGMHEACAVAIAEKAVVDVYVTIACRLEALGHHGVGLAHDERVADVYMIGVPGTPAHHWRVCGSRLFC